MKLILALISLFGLLQTGFAQIATVVPSSCKLAPQGGTLTLTSVATYTGEPGALGWTIELPADWRLMEVTGLDLPLIRPPTGATGKLDFAYGKVPVARAEFTVRVSYPPRTTVATVMTTALLRNGGRLSTLRPPVLAFAAEGRGSIRRIRK